MFKWFLVNKNENLREKRNLKLSSYPNDLQLEVVHSMDEFVCQIVLVVGVIHYDAGVVSICGSLEVVGIERRVRGIVHGREVRE